MGGLVPPTAMGLMKVLSFALVEARSVGLEYYAVEKGERVAVVFQQLEREVVPGEVLVHFRVHLSSTSSICH